MQKCAIKLRKSQLELASDTEFLLAKREVLHLIGQLLGETGKQLSEYTFDLSTPVKGYVNGKSWKITRGENYKGLPYLVMDYPRIENKSFPILLRTMFWWGHYFSFNLLVRKDLLQQTDWARSLKKSADKKTLVLVKNDLWEQELDEEGWVKVKDLDDEMEKLALQTGYLKLSLKLKLKHYEKMPEAATIYNDWLKALAKQKGNKKGASGS